MIAEATQIGSRDYSDRLSKTNDYFKLFVKDKSLPQYDASREFFGRVDIRERVD